MPAEATCDVMMRVTRSGSANKASEDAHFGIEWNFQ